MNDKLTIRIRLWRGAIFLVCFLLFLQCYYLLDIHYNPLARYPYGTPEQREMIEMILSDDDIDYLITSQMDPEIFLPFMLSEGFNIRNAYYYETAMQTRSVQPEIVVDFVNMFRKRWTLSEMENYLRFYSYNDIVDFYDNSGQASLVNKPDDPLLILDQKSSVWTYRPANLRMDGSLILDQEAMNAFLAMQMAASGEGIDLQPLAGYISYRQQKDNAASNPYPNSRNLPYGSREEQLGFTLILEPATRYISSIPATMEGGYLQSPLSEQDQRISDWLESHASEYGFIIRYPADKSEKTQENYQPFILRYTGITAAREMENMNLCLEEYVQMTQATK